MLVLQLITQIEGTGTVVRKLAFGEVLVTYTDATRHKPKTLLLGSADSWQVELTASTSVLTPPPPPTPIEVVLPEERDIVVSAEVSVEINSLLETPEEPQEIEVNQAPEAESPDVGNGYTLTKELEEQEETKPVEEVLAIIIKEVEYPVTAFEEIVHTILAE
tara:strand:- start:27662 stop:28147 length:486 start_codon:yes stop_codon:yes gene_type:complete